MICFAEYFKRSLTEAKFRAVSADIEEIAKKCVDIYLKKYRNKTKKQIDKITVPTAIVTAWQKYFKTPNITNVSIAEKFIVKDLETNKKKKIDFIVAFGKYDGALGYFDRANEIIVLFDDQAKDLSPKEILATFVHELTHGTQQYKTSSEEYEAEVEKMTAGEEYDPHIYYMEPLELDAQLTELAFRIQKDFQERLENVEASKENATKILMMRKLEKFLLELKIFSDVGADTYFKYEELPIPEFLSSHEEFVETLKDHTKEWRKFKQRLKRLYAVFKLHAQLTELAFRIKKDFQGRLEDINKSKQEATKVIMKKKLEKFLLELKIFIKSGAETYFKYEELPIPEFLSRHEEFVETLKDHPKEWKKFKQRLVDLYDELEEEQKNLLAP